MCIQCSKRVVAYQYCLKLIQAIYLFFFVLPDPDRTFFCNPGRENDIKIRLEDFEKRAPSPLSFTLIGTSGVTVVTLLDFCQRVRHHNNNTDEK